MRRSMSFRDFDWTLLAMILMLALIGVAQIYSASFETRLAGLHVKQMYWIGAGLAVMFLVSLFDYHWLLERIHWGYAAGLLLLAAVPLLGVTVLGAKRWIRIPGVGLFQPSEWMKIIIILAVARYVSSLNPRDVTWSDLVKAGLIVGVPFVLVRSQPDLGTALTYIPPLAVCLFLGGMRLKHIAVLGLAAMLMLPVVWKFGLKPYQKERVAVFLNPEADPRGTGYQIQQSLIAVGAGGIWGKGIGKGSQTQGLFLPVPTTDFIFATLAEEQGFVGAAVVLLLYLLVVLRLIQNAQTAQDRAGTLIIMGVASILLFHVMVNVGMVVGFMPVTGIPLPLLSYGGSAVMFVFLALGLVMNVRMRRFVN